jgi:hypothetical protein
MQLSSSSNWNNLGKTDEEASVFMPAGDSLRAFVGFQKIGPEFLAFPAIRAEPLLRLPDGLN